MDYNYIKNLDIEFLKELANDMDIKNYKNKNELINSIINCFKEYDEFKNSYKDKYTTIKQIGNKGKEGITYLVSDNNGNKFAMKTFNKRKSINNILKEAELQIKASK